MPDYTKQNLAIQVSWVPPANNGAPITGYQLWMSQESEPSVMIFDGSYRADILTYTVTTGITKSFNYNFYVVAINAVGVSPNSQVLTSFAAVVPSAPLNFNVTSSNLGSVTLAW
jgi:hypothetical protein